LTLSERLVMLKEISSAKELPPVQRMTLQDGPLLLKEARLSSPRANTPYWTSWDGPLPETLHIPEFTNFSESLLFPNSSWPPALTNEELPLEDDWLGPKFYTTENITNTQMLRTVVKSGLSGDSLIHLLLRHSGPRGVSSLLPPSTDPRRAVALRAFSRYAYTQSSLDGRYFMMTHPEAAKRTFTEWNTTQPAAMCVNDAMEGDNEVLTQGVRFELQRFMMQYLPGESPVERRDSVLHIEEVSYPPELDEPAVEAEDQQTEILQDGSPQPEIKMQPDDDLSPDQLLDDSSGVTELP